MSTPRILFLPLSNVLGHLTRTFSLAEKLLEQNAEVHIASNLHYSKLIKALPEGITIHQTIEMPFSSSRAFGPIKSYSTGKDHDLMNLESANKMSAKDLKIRSQCLKKMVAHDQQLITYLKPDIIVTDYRYTVTLLPQIPDNCIFHITNILGFLSFYNRIRGKFFSPLDTGNLLAPSIRIIEQDDDKTPFENSRINWCGHFSWQGWKRLYKETMPLTKVDVFLCFGSTGNGAILIPWLIKNISKHHSIRMVADNDYKIEDQENLHRTKFGYLEQCLIKSRIVCCHGGHGTVMECLLHKTPMLIFPNNLEQLEIGRRVEELGLGILMNKPQEMINKHDLNDAINSLLNNTSIKRNLELYSELLKQQDGSSQAAAIIFEAFEALVND